MEKAVKIGKTTFSGQMRILIAVCAAAAAFMLLLGSGRTVHAAGGLDLSTEYPGIYSEIARNASGSGQNADVEIASLPEGWEGYLQGGSYEVSQVYVPNRAGGDFPDPSPDGSGCAGGGTYQVTVDAAVNEEIRDSLTLSFIVKEVNAGAGSFTTEYPEQEGTAETTFSFSTTLINNGLSAQSYSFPPTLRPDGR